MKKYISTLVLLISNIWLYMFLWSNYDVLAQLKTEQNYVYNQLEEDLYLSSVESTYIDSVSIHSILNKANKRWDAKDVEKGVPIHLSKMQEVLFTPKKLIMPWVGKNAPIFNVNYDLDNFLLKGVVNFNKNKKSIYLFGHSSLSKEKGSEYGYIFSQNNKFAEWSKIFIESNDFTKVYEYVDDYIVSPDELNSLSDEHGVVYLITCYPFNTNYKRLIVKFKEISTIKK